jgi:hypothetical protein
MLSVSRPGKIALAQVGRRLPGIRNRVVMIDRTAAGLDVEASGPDGWQGQHLAAQPRLKVIDAFDPSSHAYVALRQRGGGGGELRRRRRDG